MGRIVFDTNVFISHASSLTRVTVWMHQYVVKFEVVLKVKQAVQAYLNGANTPGGPSRQAVDRCIVVACYLLNNLSDEDWDALEPLLAHEIAVLHNSEVPTWWTP
jgi:hypothetical protein